MTRRPITDDELHAYIDGQLDDARRAEVAAYLAAHPELAARAFVVSGFGKTFHVTAGRSAPWPRRHR